MTSFQYKAATTSGEIIDGVLTGSTREHVIAKLQSLTNLRAVEDPEDSTGWTIALDPFPGWKEVPEW